MWFVPKVGACLAFCFFITGLAVKFALNFLLVLSFFSFSAHADVPSDVISDGIESDFFAWERFNEETAQAKDNSVKSLNEACTKWKSEVRQSMGAKLRYLECGTRYDQKGGAYLSTGGPELAKYFIGSFAVSVGTILVNVPSGESLVEWKRSITGDAFKFQMGDFSSMLKAFGQAKQSYLAKCEEWKQEAKKQFDSSLVLASCGRFVEGDTVTLSNRPQDAWKSRFEFSSKATLYYFRKNP